MPIISEGLRHMTADHLWILICIAGAVVAFGGWLFRRAIPAVRHFFHRIGGALDAIAGREEYTDPATGRKVERLLPLTTRMATVEDALIQIAKDRSLMHRLSERVAHVEVRTDAQDARLDSLEKAAIDRVATKVENAAAMNMIDRLRTDLADSLDVDEEDQ